MTARTRKLLMTIRAALIMAAKAIEEYLGSEEVIISDADSISKPD